MHFRVLPTVLIGLGLIFLGVTGYFSVERWMSTRIVYPLNMPISLAPGHIRTRPFQLNLRTDYFVIIAISDSWQWAQAHPRMSIHTGIYKRAGFFTEKAIL